jgi:hypothetical protein
MKRKTAAPTRVPTDDEKLRAFDLVYNRLYRAFTLFIWIKRVHPMLAEHPRFQEEKMPVFSIKNACVESTLMSLRDLDDFFRPRTAKDRDSDLRATDFRGFKSPGAFLSKGDRASINQHVAHLSYHPVWAGTTGIAPDTLPYWNTADFVGKAARATFGFMDHLGRELAPKHPEKALEIGRLKRTFERLLKEMEDQAASETGSLPKDVNESRPKI